MGGLPKRWTPITCRTHVPSCSRRYSFAERLNGFGHLKISNVPRISGWCARIVPEAKTISRHSTVLALALQGRFPCGGCRWDGFTVQSVRRRSGVASLCLVGCRWLCVVLPEFSRCGLGGNDAVCSSHHRPPGTRCARMRRCRANPVRYCGEYPVSSAATPDGTQHVRLFEAQIRSFAHQRLTARSLRPMRRPSSRCVYVQINTSTVAASVKVQGLPPAT